MIAISLSAQPHRGCTDQVIVLDFEAGGAVGDAAREADGVNRH
jgi:hypothetical protein